KGELGEDVPEFEGQPAGADRIVEYAPEEEPARAFQGLAEGVVPGIALLLLAVEGEGHGGAGHEHEGGLHQVPCPEAVPGVVGELDEEAVEGRAGGGLDEMRVE